MLIGDRALYSGIKKEHLDTMFGLRVLYYVKSHWDPIRRPVNTTQPMAGLLRILIYKYRFLGFSGSSSKLTVS